MSKKDEKTGDQETDDILAEMEAEGLELPAFAGEKAAADSQEDAEVHSPELEESEEESKDDASRQSDDDSGEDDSDDEEEAGDGESAEGEEEESEGDKHKPLSLKEKYRREKKLRKDAETALSKALAAKSDEQFDAEIKAFAEKAGMNLDIAKGFIELAAKRAGLPKDVMEDIQASQKERRDRTYWDDQRKGFEKDFSSNVIPVLQQFGLKEDAIKAIHETLNADESSPNWAWAKSNKQKSLVQLALTRTSGNRTSSEASGNRRVRTPSGKAPEEMTAEDMNAMSDEEFDSFSDKLGKQSRSVVHSS